MQPNQTRSLCKTCLRIIDAERIVVGNVEYIQGICPEHGFQRGVREPNAAFLQMLRGIATPENLAGREATSATMINVTNRCNVRCPQCYHAPSKDKDPSIEELLPLFKRAQRPLLGIQGAEPTVRDDLPDLIAAIKASTGKPVVVCTNGQRLADRNYCRELVKAGLDAVAFSLHTPEYVGQRLYDQKLEALENINAVNLHLPGVSITLNRPEEVRPAIESVNEALKLCKSGTNTRFRVAGDLGDEKGSQMRLSDLVLEFNKVLDETKTPAYIMKGSHPYLLLTQIGQTPTYLIRWPTLEETDMEDLKHVPMSCLFVPEFGEGMGIHQGHLFAHVRRGGKLPPKDHLGGYTDLYSKRESALQKHPDCD